MYFMKGSSGRLALAVAIPLLVIPLAALAWLAARSVDQQESEMRARLRESLLLEVAQTNARIGAWFAELPSALGESAPLAGTSGKPTARELAAWKEKDPLVGIPFLLDAKGSIVYPDSAGTANGTGTGATEETRLFYWRYMNVFGNAERIPVYRNIAVEYESSIVEPDSRGIAKAPASRAPEADRDALKENADALAPATAPSATEPVAAEEPAANAVLEAEKPTQSKRSSPSSFGLSAKKKAVRAETDDGAETENDAEAREPAKSSAEPSPLASAPSIAPAPAKDDASTVRTKVAQSIFETDTAVQKQVYELAAEEGKETLKRNVNPQIDAVNTRDSAPARSVYIESDR